MKIIQKGTMPDGTAIQIEDWSDSYRGIHSYADTIAAYPVAKYSVDGTFSPKAGVKFRADFKFENYEITKQIFENLLYGAIALESLGHYMTEPRYRKCLTGNPKD